MDFDFSTTGSVVRIILQITGLFLLLGVAVALYTRTFRKRKLQLVNSCEFITSRDNRFSGATQFLIKTDNPRTMKLCLLDENENELGVLMEEHLIRNEQAIDFDPRQWGTGKYYLSLTSDDTNILRKIEVINQPNE